MIKKYYLLLILILPLFSFAQFPREFEEMASHGNPEYSDYEHLLFRAAKHVFDQPIDKDSPELIAAFKIIGYWKKREKGFNIPVLGKFYYELPRRTNQPFLYEVAMTYYSLKQKLEKDRLLECKITKGKDYSKQEDVREVLLGGAKIFLNYLSKKENGLIITPETKKYLKALKKGGFDKLFYDGL